ncbi:uncharacterized protein LOC108592705 [Callithrix jacchus]
MDRPGWQWTLSKRMDGLEGWQWGAGAHHGDPSSTGDLAGRSLLYAPRFAYGLTGAKKSRSRRTQESQGDAAAYRLPSFPLLAVERLRKVPPAETAPRGVGTGPRSRAGGSRARTPSRGVHGCEGVCRPLKRWATPLGSALLTPRGTRATKSQLSLPEKAPAAESFAAHGDPPPPRPGPAAASGPARPPSPDAAQSPRAGEAPLTEAEQQADRAEDPRGPPRVASCSHGSSGGHLRQGPAARCAKFKRRLRGRPEEGLRPARPPHAAARPWGPALAFPLPLPTRAPGPGSARLLPVSPRRRPVPKLGPSRRSAAIPYAMLTRSSSVAPAQLREYTELLVTM